MEIVLIYIHKSINDACQNYRSPCRFHAKSIQLNCNDQSIF